jgi:pimeloyl-ACP methyl ester carboxylesterase
VATFCLLHGKWHDGSCWEPLARELEQRGHRCLTPDVPFGDPVAGHEQRARPAIEALRGAWRPVAVVGHSLSAGVAALAAADCDASLLVYLCPAPTGPFAGVDVGVNPIREGFPFPPDREDGTSVWDPAAAIAAMYPRLPRDTARALAARLRPAATMPDPFPLASHPDIPATLVAAREDELFVPEWSRRVAASVLHREAIEIATGHFPMIEAPGELARLLDELAAGLTDDE